MTEGTQAEQKPSGERQIREERARERERERGFVWCVEWEGGIERATSNVLPLFLCLDSQP